MLPTRRRVVQAAAFWPAFRGLQAARKDFWNGKEPSQWTPEEKQLLLYRSPWAREGTLRVSLEGKRGGQPAVPSAGVAVPGGGVPGARPGAMPGDYTTGSVPIGETPLPPPRADKGEPPQFPVLVRWESARPVRLAGGLELPEDTARFYVISLKGMPLLRPRPGEPDPNQAMLASIRQSSRIERKEKIPIPCDHLLTGSGQAAADLLLFFARDADPIVPADKEVTFVSRFGTFLLSVKFPLKEMMYKGSTVL